MKDIIFDYKGTIVRTAIINEEVYFCVADVGKILELKDVHRQARRLPEKGRTISPTPTKSGVQNIMYVNEPNLYRLIFKSNKPESKEFQNWVFEQVLPSIRKKGYYSIPRELKKKSKSTRNAMTNAWSECGIDKPHQFIQLTLQEYKALGFQKGKKKKDFDEGEIKLLMALEAMEMLNLHITPKEGYYECRDSLKDTANNIISYTGKKALENTKKVLEEKGE